MNHKKLMGIIIGALAGIILGLVPRCTGGV
jgi:hypothetical protein